MKTLTTIIAIAFVVSAALYCTSQEGSNAYECLKCHTDGLNFGKIHLHPLVKEGKCLSCHVSYDIDLHEETFKSDLVFAACISCHPEQELGRSHPVGSGVIDPNTGDTMSCVSTCHVPHGSDHKYQLPYENNAALCRSCHGNF